MSIITCLIPKGTRNMNIENMINIYIYKYDIDSKKEVEK